MSRISTLALVCLAHLGNARPAQAQEPPPVPAAGYELFRSMFGFYGFESTDPEAIAASRPAEGSYVL